MNLTIKIILLLVWLSSIIYLWLKQPKQFKIQIVLHTALFIVLYVLIFPVVGLENPKNKRICVVDNSQTEKAILSKKDSLGITEILSPIQFKKRIGKDGITQSSILLAGVDFEPEFIGLLANFNVEYWANIPKNLIQNLSYQGILNQNQTQVIRFTIDSQKIQYAKLRQGNTCIDSVLLNVGQNSAELSFPVFGIGRNQLMVEIENSNTPIRFFVLKAKPKNILIRTSSPDFEFKILADWLSKQGHNVQLITDVSANISTEISYSKAQKAKELDLYICSPDMIMKGNKSNAKAVFVMGLTNAEKDIALINKTLGSNFEINKNKNVEAGLLKNPFEIFPYSFKAKSAQFYAPEYEIISQSSRVGTTLLQTTYPLILAGDSTTYAKIWNNIFQIFDPIEQTTWHLESPIIQNNTSKVSLPYQKDSLSFENRKVGVNNKEAYIFSRSTGWKTIGDSLEVFVDSSSDFYAKIKIVNKVVKNYRNIPLHDTSANSKTLIPNELLYILLLAIYGGIWFINRR
jgi:hypothetical protein